MFSIDPKRLAHPWNNLASYAAAPWQADPVVKGEWRLLVRGEWVSLYRLKMGFFVPAASLRSMFADVQSSSGAT